VSSLKKKKSGSAPGTGAKRSSSKKMLPAIAAAMAASLDSSENELTSPEKKSAARDRFYETPISAENFFRHFLKPLNER
jgi:hypothetical protein